MEIKNLCPHDVAVWVTKDNRILLPRTGTVARILWKTNYWKMVNGIPIHKRIMRGYTGLPDPHKGVLYLVSNLVQEKLSDEREDLVSPDRFGEGSTQESKMMDRLVRWV